MPKLGWSGKRVSEERGGAERKVEERERTGERTKSAAPATAPADILLFSLHITVTSLKLIGPIETVCGSN